MTDNDPVNHPKHYTSHPSGIEAIEITRHMNFNIGNAVKYLWRSDLKGALIQDLQKARWYIDDEIKRMEKINSVSTAPKFKEGQRVKFMYQDRLHTGLIMSPDSRIGYWIIRYAWEEKILSISEADIKAVS